MKKNKTIFILGANGFIGNALIEKLAKDKKFKIYGIDLNCDNLNHSLKKKNFFFKKGDITKNSIWIKKIIKKCDIIVPLVAIATPNIYVKNPTKIFELDFEANLKIIKLIVKYKKRIIFPSTSEVYGMNNDKKFREYKSSLVVGPVHKTRWIYSVSKQLLDRIIIAYAEKQNIKYNIFRPFNWIGPKLDSLKLAQLGNGRVLTIFINNLIKNKNLVIVGSGLQARSFTYLDDGINALIKIIKNNKINGKIFNIGNPKNNTTIVNFAKLAIKEFNKISKKKYRGKLVKKTELEFYGKGYQDIPTRVPDIFEAKKHLNWKPKFNLQQSINMTIKSFIETK